MASTYHGDPTATQAPDLMPLPGDEAQISLPASTDGGVVANWYQMAKSLADKVTYLMLPGRRRVWAPTFLGMSESGSQNTTISPLSGDPTIQGLVSTASSTITYEFKNGSSITLPSPYSTRLVELKSNINGGYSTIQGQRGFWTLNHTHVQVCYEVDVAMVDKTVGDYAFGLTSNVNVVGSGLGIYAQYNNGSSSNWQLVANSTTNSGTVAAAANNTIQRLKLIISGSTTPRGVAAGNVGVVRMFVNDTLAYTYTGTLTAAAGSTYFWPFVQARGGASGTADAYVSPWTVSWNSY